MIVPLVLKPVPLTPGVEIASDTKLRPLSGSSFTKSPGMTRPIEEDWLSSSGADATTSTVSVT